MVSTSAFVSVLGMALLGTTMALPQAPEPTPTQPGPAPAASSPSIQELEQIKMEFPPVPAAELPIQGKENSTLLVAAPVLQEIVDTAPTLNETLTKRAANPILKREVCYKDFEPAVYSYIWSYYANNFCNYYFAGSNAYYIAKGSCVTGVVPRYDPIIPANLNYQYCARSCGDWPNFVALTNEVCKAQFARIIHHAISHFSCPGYWGGWRPYLINGGDNSDQPADAADWSIKATW